MLIINHDYVGKGSVPYATVMNHIVRDNFISVEARLIYCYLCGLESGVEITDPISVILDITKDKVVNCQKELLNAGYIKIENNNEIHVNF